MLERLNEYMEEADRMSQAGETILKLNIGNPAPFGFRAPQPVVEAMARQLTETEGYSDSKGLLAAREAIVEYESSSTDVRQLGVSVDDAEQVFDAPADPIVKKIPLDNAAAGSVISIYSKDKGINIFSITWTPAD